ncbi:ATP-binding cassette subfamily B protein [Paenibacillus castaneae]|uniref:ABC transporter ATP-binding protein n=1 Tax=Paenibacillus castaneae TaxID=474957 RepID=UPI000C9AC9CA|nr:ABC transporter ATP-binding protein [Paenibacillus castaneae]NIK78989.1 ATP-binding cassette subfamily B protein [Paenibacillus castaneae]
MYKKTRRLALGRSIFLLLYKIWRGMPVLTSVWLCIPLLAGLLIIPSYSAQKNLVDLFVGGMTGKDWANMLPLALPALIMFTGAAIIRAVLSALQSMTDSRLRDRASMHVQAQIHERAVSVSLERINDSSYYDRLQRAETAAATNLFGFLQNIMAIISMLFELLGLLIVASSSHIVIGLLLAVVFLVSFAIRLESDIVVRRLNRDLTSSGRQSDYLRKLITEPATIRDMRISGSIDYLIGKWRDVTSSALSLRMNARRREIRRGMLVSALQIAGLFGAIVWMALHLKSGIITAGVFIIVFQSMRRAYGISSAMAFPIGKIYIQGASLFDLVEFLREPSEADRDGASELRDRSGEGSLEASLLKPGGTGRIAFEKVTYKYAGSDNPVLQNIQLTLNPGEVVALVGENGAGKSTLAQILLGLIPPSSGRITWDDTDYKHLQPKELRKSMSAVFQDFVRYETTVRDNVAFGLVDELHNEELLRRNLRLGGADELERMIGGLDAGVGMLMEGDRELSGGQWQRLAIARAAMRDAKLLVLDEPTAALDPQHESELYHSFRELAKGRTVLFVSHRLGWARYADRIIVLRNGRIVEDGSHDKLLAAGKEYASMFRAQAEWYNSSKK